MPKILIADDDRSSCKLLAGLVSKWGYQVRTAFKGDEALHELLKPDAPRLAILDWMMPVMDGTQIIKQLRATRRDFYTYALLLTSKAQHEDLLQGFDAGADDFLIKPFDAPELQARLRAGVRILGLESKLASAMEAPEFVASHDFATGLYNRSAIIQVLNREALHSDRAGKKISVLLVEVDYFKDLGERYGQPIAEQIVRQLAPKMSSDLRPYDLVGRFSGGQFLIVCPNCSLSHARVVANRLRQAIASERLTAGENTILVTVSVGVSTVKEHTLETNAALRNADSALQQSREKGPNRVECCASSNSDAEPSPRYKGATPYRR